MRLWPICREPRSVEDTQSSGEQHAPVGGIATCDRNHGQIQKRDGRGLVIAEFVRDFLDLPVQRLRRIQVAGDPMQLRDER